MLKLKRGGMELMIIYFNALLIFFVLIFFSIFVLQFEMNKKVDMVREDLHYMISNMMIGFDEEELSYYHFVVDEIKMKYYLQQLLNANYENVFLEHFQYHKETYEFEIALTIQLYTNLLQKKNKVSIVEKIKIEPMKFENNSGAVLPYEFEKRLC